MQCTWCLLVCLLACELDVGPRYSQIMLPGTVRSASNLAVQLRLQVDLGKCHFLTFKLISPE